MTATGNATHEDLARGLLSLDGISDGSVEYIGEARRQPDEATSEYMPPNENAAERESLDHRKRARSNERRSVTERDRTRTIANERSTSTERDERATSDQAPPNETNGQRANAAQRTRKSCN